jgi:hypothetical protein
MHQHHPLGARRRHHLGHLRATGSNWEQLGAAARNWEQLRATGSNHKQASQEMEHSPFHDLI